jgi:cardiolipin synthase (CMP-forming)
VARRPLTARRLLGLDRSGPPPPETRAGAPLNPWTIPNAIGFVRLALIPVFLVVAIESRDGRSALAAALFALIAWSDYFDGIAARVTGQYSRLGTLLDPATDRLLIVSGAAIAFAFDLLPRWALIVLAAREVFMLLVSQFAMRRLDMQVRMVGRWAVWPTMSALFFAMLIRGWLPPTLLYIGLALTLIATALYLRDGWRVLRSRRRARPRPQAV